MTEPTEPKETNRDRVRRLLLVPLGFRSPKGTDPAAERAALDGICDDLAYLTDGDLAVLARMLAVHGDGSAKCFWPPRATFVGLAHLVRPRPLDQDPKLVSWFASVEGQRMVQDGTLVETWQYFERRRLPPATPQMRALVLEQAKVNARRLQVVRERREQGWPVSAEDAAWSAWYEAKQADLTALVARVQAERASGVAA